MANTGIHLCTVLLMLLASLMLPVAPGVPVPDAVDQWQRRGLDGRAVYAAIVDAGHPQRLYAGGGQLLQLGPNFFRSDDAGATWQEGVVEHPSSIVTALAAGGPDTVYALNTLSGLFTSSDAGTTWTHLPVMVLPNRNPYTNIIFVDPANPKTVYLLDQANGIRRLSDGGAVALAPPECKAADAMAWDPRTPDTFVLVNGCGIFLSRDAGANWQQPVMRDTTTFPTFNAVTISPSDPRRLYTGGGLLGAPTVGGVAGYLWRSNDGGASWSRQTLDFQIDALVVPPHDPDTLVAMDRRPELTAAFHLSRDGGQTWAVLSAPPLNGSTRGFASPYFNLNLSGNRILLGTVDGLWELLLSAGTGRDPTYFPATGYRIGEQAIWSYFQSRGGSDTFGYPVSRTFRLQSFPVQIFQRHVLQIWPGGTVRPLNLLDPDILPITTINFSTFPPHDPAVATAAPTPDTPNYGAAVMQHLQTYVPNTWQGQPVNFLQTYLAAAPASAGGARPLLALEVWGFPTSRPMRDPNNANFIYQRFQRGILHYDATTGVTRGILLGDAFKDVLLGQGPADLQAQLQGSRFFQQYCPEQPGWLCRPAALPQTDLSFAFEQQ